ncbi:type II secretion system protein J [Krasilnikovia sp. MM14-A1259]|uniref:type II secretion system protein J n=1 Tax=Krasilnikovia sp. MM14-A1259 TaxID=3373539 RepID=UPI0038277051
MRKLLQRAATRRDDEGLSLIEMMVTMGIMSVIGAMFTTGVMQVYRANNLSDTRANAQSQLHTAFQRFDRELRYASWISEPGPPVIVAADRNRYYVEFAESDATRCVRLRLDTKPQAAPNGQDGTGVLSFMRWTIDPNTKAVLTTGPWTTVASNIVVAPGEPPFDRQEAGTQPYATAAPYPTSIAPSYGKNFSTAFDRLRIRFMTKLAGSETTVDTSFTAVNTDSDSHNDTTNACGAGRPS